MFETSDSGDKPPTSKLRLLLSAVVILAFLGLGYVAIKATTGSYQLALGKDGVSISVEKKDNFIDILDRALNPQESDETTQRTMRAILLENGFVDVNTAASDVKSVALLNEQEFYSANDPKLVGVLAGYDYSQEQAKLLQNDLRKLLWELKGPFGPGTLSGAQAQFLQAIEELYEALKVDGVAAPLVKEFWVRSIEWQSPFERLKFAASVEILPRSVFAGHSILICKGSEHLAEKYLKITVPDPTDATRRARGTGSIEQIARVSNAFPCDGGSSVTEMLTGRTVRLAVTEDLARQILLPGDEFGPLPRVFDGQFLVRPRYLVSADQLVVAN